MSRPLCSSPGCLNVARRKDRGRYAKECHGCFEKRTAKTKPGSVQRRFKRMRTELCRCEACGIRHDTPAFFDVHHIDGNHRNNHRTNLIVVCPNCHREAHLGMVDARLGSPLPEFVQQPRLFL